LKASRDHRTATGDVLDDLDLQTRGYQNDVAGMRP
jgi:hypothetical protein